MTCDQLPSQGPAPQSVSVGFFLDADPQSGLADGLKIGRTQDRSNKDPALTQPPARDKQTIKRIRELAPPDHRLDLSEGHHTFDTRLQDAADWPPIAPQGKASDKGVTAQVTG